MTRPTERQPSSAKSLLLFGLFVLSFAAATFGLRRVLPEAASLSCDTKLAEFERTKDSYDAIFVGSSRTYRGFVPELFDELMGAQGHPLVSFNFGVLGNRATESLELLKKVARLEPARLKWIFVDPEPLSMLLDEQNADTRRVIDWHDPRTTLDVVELLRATDLDPEVERAQLWKHWNAFVYNALNVGAGSPLLDELFDRVPDREDRDELLGPRRDGYRPQFESVVERVEKGNAAAQAVAHNWPRRAAALEGLEIPKAELAPHKRIFFERIQAVGEALGATVVFVIQPTNLPRTELLRARDHGHVDQVFHFGDPVAYPGLYKLERRFDMGHANHAGAELFTTLLAREFGRFLRERDDS